MLARYMDKNREQKGSRDRNDGMGAELKLHLPSRFLFFIASEGTDREKVPGVSVKHKMIWSIL